jgi:hemolysin activation/secretion protein
MTLHVLGGRKFRRVAQIDNHGLRTFGQERLAYRGSIFGLANMGDRLDASVALGFSEKRQIRGHFAYTTPLVDKGLTLSASVGVSDMQWRDRIVCRPTWTIK